MAGERAQSEAKVNEILLAASSRTPRRQQATDLHRHREFARPRLDAIGLAHGIAGILTQRLHELVAIGLVSRKKIDGTRGVEAYILTPKGQSLGGLLGDLYGWGEADAASFGVSVGKPLKMLDEAAMTDIRPHRRAALRR